MAGRYNSEKFPGFGAALDLCIGDMNLHELSDQAQAQVQELRLLETLLESAPFGFFSSTVTCVLCVRTSALPK